MPDHIPLQSFHTVACLQIENMAYPVTVDAIHTVFSPYGYVQKIAIFEKNNGWQVQTHPCLHGLLDSRWLLHS